MSSIENAQPGQNHYQQVLNALNTNQEFRQLAQNQETYKLSETQEYTKSELELAKKVVEAEYIHQNGTEADLEGTFFSNAGSEEFEQILQGAKQQLTEEKYNAGKAYLLAQGSDVITDTAEQFLNNYETETPLISAEINSIFRSEFDDTYDPESHSGVNPEYI